MPEEEKNEQAPEPVLSAREQILQDMEGEASTPEPETDETVEKQEESLSEEESTSPEPTVESTQEEAKEEESEEPKEDIAARPELTDEDLESVYKDKKSNVEKRISKLVAQRNSAQEDALDLNNQIKELKEKIASLEKGKSEPKKDEFQEFTIDELATALDKAREDGDTRLELQIQEHIAEKVSRKKEAITQKSKQEEESFKAKELENWNKFVENFPYQDDPDLTLKKDSNSLLIKWTAKLMRENADHYNSFGVYRLIQAANDARDIILQSRLNKLNNKKARTLQKALEREKLKNELGDGSQGDSRPSEPIKSKSPFEDALAERLAIQKKSRLMTS